MHEPTAICTSLLILATCVASYLGFRNQAVEAKYIFSPERILLGKEYYRLVTSAFLHSGWGHLLWNMVGLYSFGRTLEWSLGWADFLLIYFGSVIGGNLLSLYVHRHHEYAAYGALGGVCGVIFAYLLLFPGAGVALYFALPIPGWLYGIGFILGAFVGLKNARDNIGHDAHLGGATVGLLIAAALEPDAVRDNWRVFFLMLVLSILVLVYLWANPAFLPLPSFFARTFSPRNRGSGSLKPAPEASQVDAILDKIARNGVNSLSAEERRLLEEVSGKYRRRAESRKAGSSLTI
jgi:membrane associated rhomboid family serine protease